MNIQAIYKKAVNNGYEAKTVQYTSGKLAVLVNGWNTPDFYNCIHNVFKKCNVHIDFNMYTMTAHIMDNSDYEADSEYNTAKTELHNIFWLAIHNGKNQEEAKTIQYEYAVQHNCIDIFDMIYA